jgi:hypothetical protein
LRQFLIVNAFTGTAMAEFDKAMTVAKLRGARDRKRATGVKVEGRLSHAQERPEVVAMAKSLHALRLSLRAIAVPHRHSCKPAPVRVHVTSSLQTLGAVWKTRAAVKRKKNVWSVVTIASPLAESVAIDPRHDLPHR